MTGQGPSCCSVSTTDRETRCENLVGFAHHFLVEPVVGRDSGEAGPIRHTLNGSFYRQEVSTDGCRIERFPLGEPLLDRDPEVTKLILVLPAFDADGMPCKSPLGPPRRAMPWSWEAT